MLHNRLNLIAKIPLTIRDIIIKVSLSCAPVKHSLPSAHSKNRIKLHITADGRKNKRANLAAQFTELRFCILLIYNIKVLLLLLSGFADLHCPQGYRKEPLPTFLCQHRCCTQRPRHCQDHLHLLSQPRNPLSLLSFH